MSLRLPVFVATSGLLAVTAHASATGMLPSARSVGVAVLAAAGLGSLHRRREARFESLTLLLLATQAVVHVVLCLGSGLPVGALLRAGDRGTLLAGLYPGHTMLLAHVLAVGVAGWWLAHGEAAAWAAARRVLRAVRPVAVAPLVVVRPPRVHAARPPVALRDQVRALRNRPRRGPPLLSPAL
jgi:hypothetical protein